MHADGHFFNPDDGKQPKTFGLNFLIFYIRYICMRVDGNFFNPDDGKQPKTFGLNFLILQFLTF